MSVVDMVERACEWAAREVCGKVELKLPDDKHVDGSYPYTLVHPSVHAAYVPTKDRKPPKDMPVPSVCVQIIHGEEPHDGSLYLRFSFLAWDPGTHEGDVFEPDGNGTYAPLDDHGHFDRLSDGWRDVWNFVDVALHALRSGKVGGYAVSDVEYGPYAVEDDIPTFYPYWYAWIECRLAYGIPRAANSEYL
jgi:hypothetical protein